MQDLDKKLAEIASSFEKDPEKNWKKLVKLRADCYGDRASEQKLAEFLNKNRPIQNYANTHTPKLSIPDDNVFFTFPPEIELDELYPGGKVESAKMIQKIQEYRAEHPDVRRISKHELGTDHTIVYGDDGVPYAVCKELGKGSFGKVSLMQNLETGEWVTQKTIELIMKGEVAASPFEQALLNQYIDERKASAEKEQANLEIVGQSKGEMFIREANERKNKKKDVPKKGQQVVLMMSYEQVQKADDYVFNNEDRNDMPVAQSLQLILNFLSAYDRDVKSKGLVSRDLKRKNMRVNSATGEFSIVDQGSAIKADEVTNHTGDFAGTIAYTSPELYNNYNLKLEGFTPNYQYSEKTDVYSLGICVVEYLGLELVYSTRSEGVRLNYDIGHTKWCSPTCEIKKDSAISSLPEEEQQEIVDYINKMLSTDPKDRPTNDEAMKFFKEKIENCPEIAKTRRIAILDVEEYQKASPSEKVKMRIALKGADEVWLLDAADKKYQLQGNVEASSRFRRELEDAKIRVGNRCVPARDSLNAGIEAILDEAAKDKTSDIRGFYFVTGNPKVSVDEKKIHVVHAGEVKKGAVKQAYDNSFAEVTDPQKQKVKAFLQKEIGRIGGKLSHSASAKKEVLEQRIEALKAYEKELDQTSSLTFGQLENDLKTLEKRMFSTGFSAKSTGEKNIKTFRGTLDQAAQSAIQAAYTKK